MSFDTLLFVWEHAKRTVDPSDHQKIRQLLDDYLRMYASRDDLLTTHFSEDFSGFTGGGDFLVKDKAEWVAITRQDFAQVKNPIHIDLKDLAIQSLADTIAVATSFFTIHLPIKDHILSRETARLVLIFRKEPAGWKISHSSISIPYHLVREGEVYPMKELVDRNQLLEELIAERTIQLSEANNKLHRTNEELATAIAEHEQAEEALRKNKQQYDNLVSKIPVGIYLLHSSPDGASTLDYLSPRMAEMFKASAESMLAENQILYRAIHPDDREGFFKLNREGIRNRRPFDWEGRVLVDGTVRWLHIESTPDPLENGDVLWHSVVADITERKLAQAEREKLEAQNRQLQKSESLGRMAGAIAHHFNNQLQAVMMSLELAKEDRPGNAGHVENLADAMQAARKAAEVSSLMLTYLGQMPGKLELLDIAQTCQGLLPMLRAGIPKSRIVETDFPSPGPTVRANLNQIQQVLTNLVTNAWEAGGDGTGVLRVTVKTVAAANIPTTHRYPIDWQPRDNAYACLEVADAGCGIPETDIERIFDPFFSTKFTGRGLGLSVVQGIVRSHHGVITVESKQGRGSIFRLFLPLASEALPQKSVQPAPATKTAGGTVLLVDDEPAVRIMIARALKRLGFLVHSAVDGVEAVEVFRQYRGEIRCVLCDLTMPRMDGWETLAALRKLAPGIPVILASGYSEGHIMHGQHSELPQAILRKPYELEELRSTLAQVLEHASPIQT